MSNESTTLVNARSQARPHHMNWNELNKSTQLPQALNGDVHSPVDITSTYFVLIGCRHSELGRIVRELQFVRCERSHVFITPVQFSLCDMNEA